ncbi:hypothetical protein ACOMHN_022998 [Nucella lapillus]
MRLKVMWSEGGGGKGEQFCEEQRRRPSVDSTSRPLMPPPPAPLRGPPRSHAGPDSPHRQHSPSQDTKPYNFLHQGPLETGNALARSPSEVGVQNFLNVSVGERQPIVRTSDTPCGLDPIKRLTAMVDRQLTDPRSAARLTDW